MLMRKYFENFSAITCDRSVRIVNIVTVVIRDKGGQGGQNGPWAYKGSP